jgi:hypothetical protein
MNRLITILLIPVFVVGNVLAHFPSSVAHPSHGQIRAHFHISGGSHHDHDGHDANGNSRHHDHHSDHEHEHHEREHHEHCNQGSTPPASPAEHDSDAVYLIAADSLFTSPQRCTLDIDFPLSYTDSLCIRTFANRYAFPVARLFFRTSGLPLYLLHAALIL